MPNPFRSTRRGNPCPICGDITHRCRSKNTEFDLPEFGTRSGVQFFCINYRGDVSGYKYSGECAKNARWGKYITQELSDELSEIWRDYTRQQGKLSYTSKPKLKSKHQIKAADNPVIEPNYYYLLKIEARSVAIAKLLSQLELKPKHFWALRQRGFSRQQIERHQFRSVDRYQVLKFQVDDRLAGIAPEGLSLSTNYSGLLIPIRDRQQRYLGWQVRLDYANHTRYLWASDDRSSSHLAEYDELPLGFFLPSEIKSNYIGIVEGLGFKGIHTAYRFNQVVLGASSGQFASSHRQLEEYLTQASVLTQRQKVLLYPDGGAVLNRLMLIQYQRTASLLVKLGYQVDIAWWGQITKQRGDIDEYPAGFDLISVSEFFNIAKKFVKYGTVNQYENQTQPQQAFNCAQASRK